MMKFPSNLEAAVIPGIGWGVFGLIDDSGEKVVLYEPDDRVGPEIAYLFAAAADLLAACGSTGGLTLIADGPALLELASRYLEDSGYFHVAYALAQKAEVERAAIAKAEGFTLPQQEYKNAKTD